MGIKPQHFLAAASVILILCGCEADVQKLEGRVPSGIHLGELLSTDMRILDCQRASYQLEHVTETALAEFSPLTKLYSSSFRRCITGDELIFWQAAASRKTLVSLVKNSVQGEFHFWLDLQEKRLLIMKLAT